jgi:two-component system KDP operon response regulator KdpE
MRTAKKRSVVNGGPSTKRIPRSGQNSIPVASGGYRDREQVRLPYILIGAADAQLLESLHISLELAGYQVFCTTEGLELLQKVVTVKPEAVIIDGDCAKDVDYKMCQRVRRISAVPIILLSSKNDEEEIVKGFKQGADDYITKPFGTPQLLARIEALRRRTIGCQEKEASPFTDGNLYIDFDRCQVILGGKSVKLTKIEYRLLREMVHHRGKVLFPEQLLIRVWGPEYKEYVDCLRVAIWRLRQKIEEKPSQPKYIHTLHGIGYMFDLSC